MRFDASALWYHDKWRMIIFLLLPFSWLFLLIVTMRRALYRIHWLKTYSLPIPVIVVGNMTVGGTGKTPLVIELARLLQMEGYHPGIVSRGVGGKRHHQPYQVQLNDSVEKVGDEAILLVKNTACPVVIGIDRVAAAHYLLQHSSCDVVISDDGLQHYRLGRDIEIVVIDGQRYFGNQQLLPAGPLREPLRRLHQVDYVIVNGVAMASSQSDPPRISAMTLEPRELVSIQNEKVTRQLSAFANQKIHALAAIGHPERFFQTLRNYQCDVIPHPFPDHYIFRSMDLDFAEALPIVMTEKDAVKCLAIRDQQYWYLRVDVMLDASFQIDLLTRLRTYSMTKVA